MNDQEEKAPQEAKRPTISIKDKVAAQIAASGPTVQDIVVNELVAQETTKRKDLIIKSLAELDKQRKDFKKINKPDIETFADLESPGTGSYSAARKKEITEGQQKLDKLTKAIDTALEENTAEAYAKLGELVK